ncbi:hypothetical protein [Nostoc sp.]
MQRERKIIEAHGKRKIGRVDVGYYAQHLSVRTGHAPLGASGSRCS